MSQEFSSGQAFLREEEGGVGRRTVLATFFAGLLGGAGYLGYRFLQHPEIFDLWNFSNVMERYSLLTSLAKGAPPPPALMERIQNEKNFKERYNTFEQKLGKIRGASKEFTTAENKLTREIFRIESASHYFKYLRTYLESVYHEFGRKDAIPTDLLAEKIDGFAEDRSFALICCCCGLPKGSSFDYMAQALFATGYAKRTDKNGERAEYFLEIIRSIIFLRGNWFVNLLDNSALSPRKNHALEQVWNFLNAHDLPQDLIRNRIYFEDPLV